MTPVARQHFLRLQHRRALALADSFREVADNAEDARAARLAQLETLKIGREIEERLRKLDSRS